MKTTITSFLAIFLFAGHAWSQSPERTAGHLFIEAPNHHNVRDAKSIPSSNRALISQWMNFIDLTSSYYSSTPDYDYYYTFPDSTPFADYGGTLAAPFSHSFGQVYDLTSPVLNQNTLGYPSIFDVSQTTTIDSIATYGVWAQDRSNSVDTIIFAFHKILNNTKYKL